MDRDDRERHLGQRGCVVWLTGLSGSGKSTIARTCEERLIHEGRMTFVLDGDEIRSGLNRDLTFSQEDRAENIRRIAEVSRLFAECGVICIASFISPLRSQRQTARDIIGSDRFIEVFIDTPLDLCEQRDPKGLYRKARSGEIPEFTGIGSAYEPPNNPEIRIVTEDMSIPEAADTVIGRLRNAGYLFASC